MEVEMKIRGLMMDPVTNMPIVVLKDAQGSAILPIWVGIYEANAIALEIEKVQTPRPMTHDLLKNMLLGLNVQVEKVVVNDLRDDTFYALIWMKRDGQRMSIDSRASGIPKFRVLLMSNMSSRIWKLWCSVIRVVLETLISTPFGRSLRRMLRPTLPQPDRVWMATGSVNLTSMHPNYTQRLRTLHIPLSIYNSKCGMKRRRAWAGFCTNFMNLKYINFQPER